MPVLVVAAALLALQLSPRENVFHQRPLNYKSHYENFYNRFLPCVRVTASNLQYTGLNRTVGGAVKGYYYYTLVDGFCQFYLLGAEAGTLPAPKGATQRPTGGHAGLFCSSRRFTTRWRSVANSNSSNWRS